MWPLHTFRVARDSACSSSTRSISTLRSILPLEFLRDMTSSSLGVRFFTGQIQMDLVAQNGYTVRIFCLGSIVS